MRKHSKQMQLHEKREKIKRAFIIMLTIVISSLPFNACKENEKGVPPLVPTGLVAERVGNSINLSWNSVSGATGYTIYYSHFNTGFYQYINISENTTYIDSSSRLYGDNYYTVSAFNEWGESDYSDYAYCKFMLSTPTGVNAIQSGSSIKISWDAVSEATSYYVYRSGTATGTYSTLIDVVGITNATDVSPLNGYNYYKVWAANGTMASDYSDYAFCNFTSGGGGGTTVPSAPTGVTATAQSSSSIYVSWNTVSGATSYKVYYKIGSSSTLYSAGTATNTSFSHTGLSASMTYYYYITAVNSAGESGYSSGASATTQSSGGGGGGGGTTNPPNAPTGVAASNTGSALLPAIQITWSSVTGATSYKVYRSSSSSSGFALLGTATYTTYIDSNPLKGYNYYKVSAVNSAGESALSSAVPYNNDQANAVAPCPVTYGSCTVSGTTITMRWTVSTAFGCGTPTKAYLRVKSPNSSVYSDVQTLSATTTSASFNYSPYVTPDGLVYVGIILENGAGTSGGVPKIYNTITKTWI